jgi:putative FmdB family regulatory protein
VEDPVPTYQYACTACGHRFEAVQSFSDSSLTDCPECTGRLRKVFSSVGIVFKGSGFYRTDSRSGSGDGNAAKDGAKEPAAASKDSASKDSGSKDSGSKDSSGSSTSSPSTATSSSPAAAAS